ncbi:hypothetical protein, partial [Mesorhizobium sp. M7A.F.Ca.CA.004.06.1.1]|uniref:hypothetical protein n=1 Tax=Mesorhizobium sp. M7A.F.Ca.CA.004.06.1.1 TaxID=2496686 RepID=UPI0019D22F63
MTRLGFCNTTIQPLGHCRISHNVECATGQKLIHRRFINAFWLGTAHATQSAKGARTEWPIGPR